MKSKRYPQSSRGRENYVILQDLRTEVLKSHRLLHETVVLEDFVSSRDSYIRKLMLLYGVLMPVEQMIEPYLCHLPKQLGLEPRLKTGWIEKDLLKLGLTVDEIADIQIQSDVPKINGLAEAVGALYVIEGSTFGGKIIYSTIKKELRLHQNNGARYFYGYGAQQVHKWEFFCQFIESFIREQPQHFSPLSHTARETYEAYHRWFLRNKKHQL